MITKRKGHGQTICKGCKEINWDSFLYNFNDKPYCFDCLMEKLEEYQQRIDKSLKLLKQPTPTYASCIKLLDELEEILKGDSDV